MSKLNMLVAKPSTKRKKEDLKRLQDLPLEQKINLTRRRIKQAYDINEGNLYIAFSGGKDSTVLLDIVRSLYPDISAVFCDTGLEFPEIRDFVKTKENIVWLKPKMTFKKVLETVGYPVVSKEVSMYVRDLKNPTEKNEHTRRIRLEGSEFKGGKKRTGKLSNKWLFLKDAPFKCSSRCCNIMKKDPSKHYEKETNRVPILGTMAYESAGRLQEYLKNGCNSFDGKRKASRPISFWTDNDIWEYIKTRNIKYSKIYDMGYKRTGCIFCMFGYWSELKEGQDKFELLKKTHPTQYRYCMENLGMKEIIDYINQNIGIDKPIDKWLD